MPIILKPIYQWPMILALLTSHGYLNAAEIPHDEVEKLEFSATGAQAYFQPSLYIADGCEPYAAVDAQGNHSGGLANSGGSSDGCDEPDKGNTYTRESCWNTASGYICGRMYAWFFPKDRGFIFGGHRYDWEEVVIWTIDDNEVIAASFSAHGDYEIYDIDEINSDSSSVLVAYQRDDFTHATGPSSQVGDKATLVSWEGMPAQARQSLNSLSWGSANCPIKDSNFAAKIDEAMPSSIRNML